MPKQVKGSRKVSGKQLPIISRKCTRCKKTKPVDCFHKNKAIKGGLDIYCKECNREKCKKTYRKIKTAHNEYSKKYYIKHGDNIKAKAKNRRDSNIDEVRIQEIEYRKKNKDRISEYDAKRYRTVRKPWNDANKKLKSRWHSEYLKKRKKIDVNFKLLTTLRNRINVAIKKQKTNKSNSSTELLGCNIEEARKYLESLFTDGMNWSNHGLHGWHIDHIRPCASFDLTDPEQQKECFNYTNLQPLWAEDNMKKGASYDQPISSN